MAEALGTFYLPEICRKFCQIIQKTGFNEIHLHLWRHNKHITKDSVKILFNWKYSAFQHMLLSNLNNIIARKKNQILTVKTESSFVDETRVRRTKV